MRTAVLQMRITPGRARPRRCDLRRLVVRANLIDEHGQVIRPVVIGHGRSLFGALDCPLRLDVVESQSLPRGTSIQVCRNKEETP